MSGYGEKVRYAEGIYKQNLNSKMYELGAVIHKSCETTQMPFDIYGWVAWMRKADYIDKGDKVIIGIPEETSTSEKSFFLQEIFKRYHSLIARALNSPIYYALNGKVYDYANYGVRAEKQKMTQALQEEQKIIDDEVIF